MTFNEIKENCVYKIIWISEDSDKRFEVISKCSGSDDDTRFMDDIYVIEGGEDDGLVMDWDLDKSQFQNYAVQEVPRETNPEYYL